MRRVVGPASPSRRIAGQASQHGEERKGVNSMFGGFHLVGAEGKVVAARAARIKRVVENPIAQPDGSVEISRDSCAMRQLSERHSGPRHISRGAAQEEKGEARGNNENSLRVRMVHEIGLAHTPVRGGIRLLGVQQAVSQHLGAVQILSPGAQQPSHDLDGVVVNERGTLQTKFVGIALRKPGGKNLARRRPSWCPGTSTRFAEIKKNLCAPPSGKRGPTPEPPSCGGRANAAPGIAATPAAAAAAVPASKKLAPGK